MADQLTRTAHDVHNAWWNPGLVKNPAHFQRRERRHFMWLQDNGIARNHARCHLATDQGTGVVPRNDGPNHPDGHPLDPDLLSGGIRGQNFALNPACELGVVIKKFCGAADFTKRLVHRLALLHDDNLRQAECIPPDQRGYALHELSTIQG